MKERKYIYDGPPFASVSVAPITYEDDFFDLEIRLESELFFALRQQNDIKPYRLTESSETELDKIRTFFQVHRSTFFFLFDEHELIGSILLLRNYIQSLVVARPYQRQHYGTELTKFAVNRALNHGWNTVALKVLEGNTEAQRLYEKVGFREEE
ncbi:MAG: GNAT family N-acetyltransferase [Candidatus Competibacteraceae bacterium]|nr:GNAT family N-acetyltransferase [Candidatus Competibacteraceae bacterium]